MTDASQISPSATPDDSTASPRVSVKRPLEDDESFDFESAKSKRQAFESRAPIIDSMASLLPHAPHEAATPPRKTQPQEKSIADLMSMIQQMQTSHAQQIAELRDQYNTVSTHLEQLKGLLSAHFTSQVGSIHVLQSRLTSISTHETASQPTNMPPTTSLHSSSGPFHSVAQQGVGPASTPAPHYTTAARTPQTQLLGNFPAATPSPPPFEIPPPSQTSTTKTEMKITPSSVPNEPPTVQPSHIDTVAEVWEEFRYGRAGNMSVEKLDALWGPRWRQDPKLRTWYQRRKVISDRIKLYIADGIDEQDAVMEVEKMRRGRTLNWVSRILLDDQKETRKQRRVAAQAATAARDALHGMPAA